MTHPDKDFRTVNDGDTLRVAGHELRAIHTGTFTGIGVLACTRARAPCSAATPCSRAAPARRAGRTPTSRRSSTSISGRLGKLPGETVVYTGHGDSTTIGDGSHYDEWVARALTQSTVRHRPLLYRASSAMPSATDRGSRCGDRLNGGAVSVIARNNVNNRRPRERWPRSCWRPRLRLRSEPVASRRGPTQGRLSLGADRPRGIGIVGP